MNNLALSLLGLSSIPVPSAAPTRRHVCRDNWAQEQKPPVRRQKGPYRPGALLAPAVLKALDEHGPLNYGELAKLISRHQTTTHASARFAESQGWVTVTQEGIRHLVAITEAGRAHLRRAR